MKQIHEFWVTDDTEEAVRKTKITMKRVGDLTRVIPGEHIEGTVAFGVQPVRVSISWRTETQQAAELRKTVEAKPAPAPVPVGVAAGEATAGDAEEAGAAKPEEPKSKADSAVHARYASVSGGMGTSVVLEVDAEDHSGSAQRSAIERFEDAYMHFDRPDYAPDRLGVLPITIIGIVVAFILLIVFILLYPKLNRKPTNDDAGTSASAVRQIQPVYGFHSSRVLHA